MQINYYVCFVVASALKNVKRFVDKAYQNDFMKAVHRLRQNNEYTDVTLQSGDVHIRCHRVVLAVASEYFKAIFRCGEESASHTVQLTMDPDTLTSIIDYIYTGEIELTVDNVESFVVACDVLQLDGLKAGCEDFMTSQVELANCITLYRFSTLYQLCKVQRKAKGLMMAEFETVAFNDQFKEMCCSELVELIKDDDLNVDDEDTVVECVLDWVTHDLGKRMSSFETLLEQVRLPYCKSKYLWHMKDTCDLLTDKCLEYLNEAFRFQTDTAHQHEVSSCRTTPRTNHRRKSCLVVAGGLTCSEDNPVVENNRCQFYNEDKSCWETLTEMPPSLGRMYSVCYLGRSLLLTGGHNGGALKQCWLYDLATKKWEAMPPLITARCYHRSVSLDDCVYVVGGFDVADKPLASFECLNLTRRQWSSMPNMPEAVRLPMVTTYGNKVYVFGGWDAQDVSLRATQVFNTTRAQWSCQSDMTEICSTGAAVTVNDSIYLVGGYERTCLKYTPATDTWTRLSQPRESHGNAPAVVWRGCVLVAGGGRANPESSVIEQYDPVTDTWSQWKGELNVKQECHDMLSVNLYGV